MELKAILAICLVILMIGALIFLKMKQKKKK